MNFGPSHFHLRLPEMLGGATALALSVGAAFIDAPVLRVPVYEATLKVPVYEGHLRIEGGLGGNR